MLAKLGQREQVWSISSNGLINISNGNFVEVGRIRVLAKLSLSGASM